MSKSFDNKRDHKKKPTMTLKEKRQKKHEKKLAKSHDFHHEGGSSPQESNIVM